MSQDASTPKNVHDRTIQRGSSKKLNCLCASSLRTILYSGEHNKRRRHTRINFTKSKTTNTFEWTHQSIIRMTQTLHNLSRRRPQTEKARSVRKHYVSSLASERKWPCSALYKNSTIETVEMFSVGEEAARCAVGRRGSFGIHVHFRRSESTRHDTYIHNRYLVSVRSKTCVGEARHKQTT